MKERAVCRQVYTGSKPSHPGTVVSFGCCPLRISKRGYVNVIQVPWFFSAPTRICLCSDVSLQKKIVSLHIKIDARWKTMTDDIRSLFHVISEEVNIYSPY
jgi:hypothetical protein